MGVEARAPDGRTWHVRRSLPWPRWRRSDLDLDDLTPVPGEFSVAALVVAVALFVIAAIAIFFLLPLIAFVAEAVLVLVGILLISRPWRITAETAGPPAERLEWRVKGWRRSKGAVEEVPRKLSAGVEAAPSEEDTSGV